MATIAVVSLAASLLTASTSIFLLWFYRRTVARLMSAQAGEEGRRIVSEARSEDVYLYPLQGTDAPKGNSISNEKDLPDHLFRLANIEPRRHAYKYAIAGALFALVTGLSSVFALAQTQINYLRAAGHPLQFLFMFWTCAWPVVLTTGIIAGGHRRSRWVTGLFYFSVLTLFGAFLALTPTESPFQAGTVTLPAWSGESPFRLAAKWALFNGAPTLLIVLFRQRRVRGVAPLVLSFMIVVSAGVFGIIAAAFLYQETSVDVMVFAGEALGLSIHTALIGYFFLLSISAALLCGVLGWRLLVWIRNGYQRKSISDQSLAVDALWLIFTSFYAVMLAFAGPGWALSALVAFVVFKIAVGVGNKILRSKSQSRRPDPALLVLRVFSLGKRSESLFEFVAKHWRYISNVRLIAGTDLALSTVAPHQFLAFVSGKLNQLFVRSEAALECSLAELDTRRDADGRFRINDFFCHSDTWQNVLLRLVKSSDVVLMDLRSFAQSNAGCVFEINELLNSVPLERLVFVVDKTTDKRFLEQTLEESYGELRSNSPNRGSSLSTLQLFELQSLAYNELQELLRRLCAAVDSHYSDTEVVRN